MKMKFFFAISKRPSSTIPGREEEVEQSKEALAVFGMKHVGFQQRVQARIELGVLEIVLLHEQKETVERKQTNHTAWNSSSEKQCNE